MSHGNFGGLAGMAIGGAIGYGVALAFGPEINIQSAAWGAFAGCMAASIFGLLYDRSAVAEFRASYRALTRHLIQHERGGPDYDPRERIAFFGFPVAFATFIPPIVAMILWAVVRKESQFFAVYVPAGLAGVMMTMILGRATADHRLLQREIAFNTTPVVGQTAAPVPASGPPSGDELAQLRVRGRRDAVICILGGLALLAVNHWFALHDHTYSQKAVWGGPMIVIVGLFGLFEPRIMTRHLPVGKHYPLSVLMLMLLAMAIGAVGGWQLDTWYHG
jgi:hypothetical protein